MSINFDEHVLGIGPAGQLPPFVFAQLELPDANERAEMQAIQDQFAATLDATDPTLANRIATQDTATRAALETAIDARNNQGLRPLRGNRIAVLGDSTARGTYDGDSDPGIAGSSLLIHGMSWLTWAQQLSDSRIVRSINAAVIGDTLAGMLSRIGSVTNHYPKPDACVVVSGYNDVDNNVPLSQYAATWAAIHEALTAAGIEMICATPLPTYNSGATFADALDAIAGFVRDYATDHGLQVIDFNTYAKAADRGLIPEVKTDGDGVHPGAAGQIVLGQFVASQLLPRLPIGAYQPLRNMLGAHGNITPDRYFQGAVTDGVPAGTFRFGAAVAGATPSVQTQKFVRGNTFRVTADGTTGTAEYAQRIQAADNWDVGDRIAVSGICTVTGTVGARLRIEFGSGAGPAGHSPTRITRPADRAAFFGEFTIPSGGLSYIDLRMQTLPGTGYTEWGELHVYNLSKLRQYL